MVTTRTVLAGVCLAVAMLTASACAQIHEAVNGRDLECGEVPEDTCITIADHFVTLWDPQLLAQYGRLVKVRVTPFDCAAVRQPAMVRCWVVEGSTTVLADGSGGGLGGVHYYQRVDGTLLGEDGAVIGN